MESLDEFDNEYPLNMSFCKLISSEEFEEQSLTYTEQCLQELYLNMEQNPRICERALRKQKQMEKEKAGLIPYLKAKFFQALQGELNNSNYMGTAELKEKVRQLRRDMQRANSYACAAKTGKGQYPRQSWSKKHTLEGRINQLHFSVSELPNLTMPRVFGPFPEVMNKQVNRPVTLSPDLKYQWTCLTTVSKKRLLGNAPTPSQNPGSTGTKPAASVFNTSMSDKFQGGTEDDMDTKKPISSSPA